MVGREDKRTNNRTMLSTLKNNAAAGYQGPVKIELLKGAGLLQPLIVVDTKLCNSRFELFILLSLIFPAVLDKV